MIKAPVLKISIELLMGNIEKVSELLGIVVAKQVGDSQYHDEGWSCECARQAWIVGKGECSKLLEIDFETQRVKVPSSQSLASGLEASLAPCRGDPHGEA
jgi:hypothetical protein